MANTWKKATADLQLALDTVDVWRLRLDIAEAEMTSYFSLLPHDEQQRAQRFTFPAKRREFIVTRGELRRIVGQILDVDPKQITFAYTDKDKPYLTSKYQNHAITFNISHSHDMALIAITLDLDIGVDIEKIREEVKFEKLAQHYFSQNEYEALQKLPKQQLPRAFYACWTRKEAFVKALGKGIAFGLAQFSVSVDPLDATPSLITHWDKNVMANWSLVNIDVEQDYQAALAVAGTGLTIRYWD